MAFGPFTWTDPGLLAVLKQTIDVENDTIVGVLVDVAHTPSVVNDNEYSDISANECTDTDYTTSYAEGITIAGLTWSNPSSGVFMLDATDVDFGAAVTIGARYLYLLKRAGASLVSTDLILGYVDLNVGSSKNVASSNNDFEIIWGANGLFRFTVT